MEFIELKARFDDVAKRVQESVKNDTASAALIATLIGIVEILFELFANQSQKLEALTDQLANKTLNSKRANDENINGRRSERNKGGDSSDKGRKDDLPRTKKARPCKEIKVEHRESYIGYKGKELTSEEAEALIGTVFEGDDGKKYRYTRKLASSVKDELQVNLIETQYYKLEISDQDLIAEFLPAA